MRLPIDDDVQPAYDDSDVIWAEDADDFEPAGLANGWADELVAAIRGTGSLQPSDAD